MKNRVFEDFPKGEQWEIVRHRNNEWLQQMVITLSARLYEIGEQFDITTEAKEK